jgi:hypothetical protein
MIIFQRVVTFRGPQEEVIPWAQEITGAVNERTELNTSLWQGLFGGSLGTLAWSALVENLTAVEAAMETLAMDEGFQGLVNRAQPWLDQPGEDHLLRVLHTSGGDYVRPDVGAFAEVTRATPAEGRLADARAWGVEIADVHSKLTHSTVLFGASAYGRFGQLVWLGMFDSAAAVDEAAEAVGKDMDYVSMLDKGGPLFQPGTAEQSLARRIA